MFSVDIPKIRRISKDFYHRCFQTGVLTSRGLYRCISLVDLVHWDKKRRTSLGTQRKPSGIRKRKLLWNS